MISLKLILGGNGAANFVFNSGQISALHLAPPGDGSAIAVQVNQLQPTHLSLTSLNGQLNPVTLDIAEGPDPLWLSYTIDCTAGGSVSAGFAGSPTVIINPGSYLSLEYHNGNAPPPAPADS